MKRAIAAILLFLLAAALAGCKPKEMPMEDFFLDLSPRQTIRVPSGGGGTLSLDYVELEVDVPRELAVILPQIKGIAAAVTPSAHVAAEVRDGVLVLTGSGAAQEELLDITLSAPGYEDGVYQFAAGVTLHQMELHIPTPKPDTGDEAAPEDGILTLTEGDVSTLPLDAREGAAVELLDYTGDEAVEAVIEDGNLVLTALREGEAHLVLQATLDKYDPAQADLTVRVEPKPAPPPAPKAETSGTGGQQRLSLYQTPTRTADTSTYSDAAAEIVALVNAQRADYGLAPLSQIPGVDVCAALRAQEASEEWSHTRPDGTMFSTIFDECGMSYVHMGENLHTADYYRTPQQVVDAFMDSPAHRENILRESFTGIGVGIYQSGRNYFYCQLFVGL